MKTTLTDLFSCSDIACNGSDTNVVCGTNGHTYANQCELEKARCLQNDSFDAESFGPCKFVMANTCMHFLNSCIRGHIRSNSSAAAW